MDHAPSPTGTTNCRPPRVVAAASMAVGLAFAVQDVAVFFSQPWELAAEGIALTYAVVALVRVVGYFVAPFMIGRGQWYSFFAGILLAPAVASWVLMFLPAILIDPVMAILGGVSGLVLLTLYVFIFRHFVVEFIENRDLGRGDKRRR